MNTLLLSSIPNAALIVSSLILIACIIFIASFSVAELQKKKFILDYETLKDFINKAPIDKENYQAIKEIFDQTYCYSDDDKTLIKCLWLDFKVKFRSIVPVTDGDLFPKERELKGSRVIYNRLKARSNVETV